MSRARAEALVLVNWNGMFYQRFLLDRHVTALEGANGAGKTTVMVGAYVVLLPDMSRLRFTNLGETGATGGDRGVWGRLGEPGRPSYAALDLALPGPVRLVAGVHLVKKGEPSVEPTPFLVTGLDASVRLQDLMLVAQGDGEGVPELPELRENAARLGGRLTSFATAREYFLALFDHGVTALRLGTDEERNKFNEMLRTSMTGGISRALTSELRGFLLKEEGGLADTLQRMRSNLDACRRTRTEVQEAQRLEREIGGVFEAGQAMFAAAFHATRDRAEDHQRRVDEAEGLRLAAVADLDRAEAALARAVQEFELVGSRHDQAQAALEAARVRLARLAAALAAARDVERRRGELEAAEAKEREAARERSAAGEVREARRSGFARARERHKLAASGLADLQRGLEELHRRAGAHRRVVRRREEAESLLGRPGLEVAELAARIDECRSALAEADRERRDGARRLEDAASHRTAHARAIGALGEIVQGPVDVETAHAVALEALRRHRDLRALAGRAPGLGRELEDARRQAARQGTVRERAANLGLAPGPGSATDRVRAILVDAESERRRHEEAEREARARLDESGRALAERTARRRELAELEPRWRELSARARRLGEAVGLDVVDRPSLEGARRTASERLAETSERERTLARECERILAEARELLAAGGPFPPELLRLKDRLGAELLAAAFEDAALEEAGAIEARLGPLAQALVVDDPRAAARTIEDRPEELPAVWLVSRGADAATTGAGGGDVEPGSRDVVVGDETSLRVSRIPERPRLGRRARERRAEELREEAGRRERDLEGIGTERRELERRLEDSEALLADQAVWLAGDPASELEAVRRRIAELEGEVESLRVLAGRSARAALGAGPRIDDLRDLLGEAWLLDPPDHGERAERLGREHEEALAAEVEVTRTSLAARVVEDGLDVLRRRPLSGAEMEELGRRVEALRKERERLDAAIEALEDVDREAEALAWGDAPAKLASSQALVPALEDTLRQAEDELAAAEAAVGAAEGAYDAATSTWQDEDGRRRAALEQLAASRDRFEEIGIAGPTEEGERAARAEVDGLEREVKDLSARASGLATERGRCEAVRTQAAQARREAEEKVAAERREATPALERWERLHRLAAEHDLAAGEAGEIRGHVNLVGAALEQKAVLVERLRAAQGGAAVLAEVEKDGDAPEAAFGETLLGFWLAVRDWLRRRLPAQVAEVDDPREALLRLRDRLASLDERLARQERDLRGASEDVARGIDVQIRKARGQVQRLNRSLDGVSFGGVQGVRVRLELVDRMDQVLRALREGAVQGLLFQESLPIEEALDEIFRRHGGGRAGGQRLLDYREYVHLRVEIIRSSGSDWETANPTRLSTGEAIGVGAALMMVVLTEWERDANLFRSRRSSGSLRFLFLDEANRLSLDNLGVLFDLCQTLDLQLLIAAPEIAQAEGNTTYRLVRRATAEGREEVEVSGRRTRAQA